MYPKVNKRTVQLKTYTVPRHWRTIRQ